MAYTPTTPVLGLQAIATTDTTQNHPLGTIITATDPTYGTGEFIYLKGVASTVVGSLVSYDQVNGTTTLSPASTANNAFPVAVAMSANVASQYGWYQIAGAAIIKKTAVKVNPGVKLYLSSTAGRVSSTSSSGRTVLGCVSINAATVASATSTITAEINRPIAQGPVT